VLHYCNALTLDVTMLVLISFYISYRLYKQQKTARAAALEGVAVKVGRVFAILFLVALCIRIHANAAMHKYHSMADNCIELDMSCIPQADGDHQYYKRLRGSMDKLLIVLGIL